MNVVTNDNLYSIHIVNCSSCKIFYPAFINIYHKFYFTMTQHKFDSTHTFEIFFTLGNYY